MSMVDLREVKGDYAYPMDCCCGGDPCLPTIYLNREQCEALGISDDVKAGQQVVLRALAVVRDKNSSVSNDGDEKGGVEVSVTLQISNLEASIGGSSADAAAKLYGEQENA